MAYPLHGPEYHERDSWKRPCRAATTANITIATALNNADVLDGVTLATGDRVLVKDQSTASQNGVYVVGASPARAVDFGSSSEIVGAVVGVTEGTINADKAWVCTADATVTVGTTPLRFVAFGSAGDGLTDLLTGDASKFAGTIGAWAASGTGTTIAYDGTVGVNGNGAAKLHATADATSRYAEVAIPGTFKSGQLYHARLLLKQATLTTTDFVAYDTDLGLHGTDTGSAITLTFLGPTTAGRSGAPSNTALALLVSWTPSADRTGVTLRIARDSSGLGLTTDLWILEARVVAVPGDFPGLASPIGTVLATNFGNTVPAIAMMPVAGDLGVAGIGAPDRSGSGDFIGFGFGPFSTRLTGAVDETGNGSLVEAGPTFGLFLVGNGGASRRQEDSFDLEVGPSANGFYVSERSSSEVEFVPDGNVDIILVDGGSDGDTTHHWKTENSAGTLSSNLAKLHNILTGTADPTAGGGVAHPQPALYLRDNGGTTELWTPTGAGATAWQKITIP